MSDDKPFLCTAPGCGQVCIFTTVNGTIAVKHGGSSIMLFAFLQLGL